MRQTDMVMEYMAEHDGITSLEAVRDLGVTRLAARIADLRAAGIEIETERVRVPNRRGETCTVVRYRAVV